MPNTVETPTYVPALDAARGMPDIWDDIALLATDSGSWYDLTTSERALRSESHITTLAAAVLALRAETARLRTLLATRP
jgi:hypothetical protein